MTAAFLRFQAIATPALRNYKAARLGRNVPSPSKPCRPASWPSTLGANANRAAPRSPARHSQASLRLLFLAEKLQQMPDELRWRLLRYEMAAIGNHLAAHIECRLPQRLLGCAAAAAAVRIADGPANRQHRHRQLGVDEQGLVVSDVLQEPAVISKAGTHGTRLAVGAQVLIDIGRPNGIGPIGERVIEPGQIGALPALRQDLGQVRCHVELVMPAAASFREITPSTGNDDVENDQAAYRVGMGGRQRESRRAAPIVSDQKERAMTEPLGNQRPNIMGDGLFVVAAERT